MSMHPAGAAGTSARSDDGTVDLSIVIVNWNTCQLTSEAIASVERETRGISYEIILVDNGSTHDDSVTELPRQHPGVTWIANSTNLGFAGANNQGIASARGRYVVLLNSDTIQTQDALGASVRYMDAHPQVGVLGILHRNADDERTVQASFNRFPNPWSDVAALLGVASPAKLPDPHVVPPEQDVDWVVGSFLFVRREVLEDVGGLDERFFLYDEDIDWCLTARRHGWTVRFWPGAEMIHLGNGSRRFMRDKTFSHFRSHFTYMRKNHSALVAWLYYAVLSVRLLVATVWQALQFLLGRTSREAVQERLQRQRQFLTLAPGRRGS